MNNTQKIEFVNKAISNKFGAFIRLYRPDYLYPSHLLPALRSYNLIADGICKRMTLSIPPQHFKTETTMMFIAYYLKKNPGHMIAYVTYAQDFSESKIVHAQNYCIGAGIKPGKPANLKEWRNKNGGGILCTSIDGGLTGQRVDLLIIDDPFKSPLEAQSRLIRDKVWNWFEWVAETRLRPESSVIVIGTRWHEDDLIGRIIKQRSYEIIRIPALADRFDVLGKKQETDILNRELEEPLLPQIFSYEYYCEVRRKNPFAFSTQYQGIPTRAEGRIFKDANFYTELPKELRISIACDPAYSENRRNDFSAIVVYARNGTKDYILHVEHYQEEIGYTVSRLKELQKRYGVEIGLECNGTQKGVYQAIEIIAPELRLNPLIPIGDKLSRAQLCAAKWNNGEILLPMEAPWLNDYLEEIEKFTGHNDTHDDLVDATVYAHSIVDELTPGIG